MAILNLAEQEKKTTVKRKDGFIFPFWSTANNRQKVLIYAILLPELASVDLHDVVPVHSKDDTMAVYELLSGIYQTCTSNLTPEVPNVKLLELVKQEVKENLKIEKVPTGFFSKLKWW